MTGVPRCVGLPAWTAQTHLPFAPSKLLEIAAAVRAMGDVPKCEIYENFVIHPTYLCTGDWNG